MNAAFLDDELEQIANSKCASAADHQPNFHNVQSIKGQLDEVLGESFPKYWSLLEAFLSGTMIKCEFDHFVLQLLPSEYGKKAFSCPFIVICF
jgi:hypothetical protein